MLYFPHNTTSCFTTELPRRIDLQGRWEVALVEIQFPSSFLHLRANEALITLTNTFPNGDVSSIEIPISSGVYSTEADLIETINHACSREKSHVKWSVNPRYGNKVSITLTCKEDKCKQIHCVKLSDKLRRILGFETTSVNTAFVIDRIDGGESFDPVSLARGIPDKLFVYCDICEPYITGDALTPLLRIVTNTVESKYGSNQVRHYSSGNYIPLRKTNFRTIEIDIRDQFGKFIPFEFGTLTVTLHFRRIFE